MGHDVGLERRSGGQDTRPASELPSSLAFLFLLLFLRSLSPFLVSCCSTPLSMEHERAGPWPDLHWWFIGLINPGL